MKAARGNGKKCMFQQACEGADIELREAGRRHAAGSPFPWQWNLDACSSSTHWDTGIPQILGGIVSQRQATWG